MQDMQSSAISAQQGPFYDLRAFMSFLEDRGELATIEGADWDLEIGVLTEQTVRKDGAPAVLFKGIPGYPPEYGVLVNSLKGEARLAAALGLPTDSSGIEIVDGLRKRLRNVSPISPVEVDDGPVMENVMEGGDVDLYRFPTPQWHQKDGGRYIGTGSLNIIGDPDEGWANIGIYRAQIIDKDRVTLHISPGKQGRIIREKYFKRGKPCPVAISVGQEPSIFSSAFFTAQWGTSEYDFAGWLRGAPVEVIKSDVTGLPIPASAEIVLEGEMVPGDSEMEGPFGEWPGYYASTRKPEPAVRIKRVLYRNNPIILGSPPIKPPDETGFLGGILKAVGIWEELEHCGITGIKGVWQMPAGGIRFLTVVALEQQYGGHARQAGFIASQGRAGGYLGRYVIVVDDDIDITDTNDVLWAIATRSDPETSIEIMHRCWSSSLDPTIPPERREKGDLTNSRAIIDATRPFEWRDQFPDVSMADPEDTRRVLEKFKDVLPG